MHINISNNMHTDLCMAVYMYIYTCLPTYM